MSLPLLLSRYPSVTDLILPALFSMSTFPNENGIPLLFDPQLIPTDADKGIKEDEGDRIIVRHELGAHLRAASSLQEKV